MENEYRIIGNGEYALVETDFSTVVCWLQDRRDWDVRVLELAGLPARAAWLARKMSGLRSAPRLVGQEGGAFLAAWAIGRRAYGCYRLERAGEGLVRVTPLGWISRGAKVRIALSLALFFVAPVLLTPLYWRLQEERTLYSSRCLLDAFARMLARDLREQTPV